MLSVETYKVRRCDACSNQLSEPIELPTGSNVEEAFAKTFDTTGKQNEEYCPACSKKIVDKMLYKGYTIDLAKSEVIDEGQYRRDLAKRGIALL